MTREQLLAKIEANIASKPIFFNTAAKIKSIFLDVANAIFDNAGSGSGLIYTNTLSTTSLSTDYNQVKNLTVNYIGAYAVGNLVKITARIAGFMGTFYNLYYLAEITAIDVNTKVIAFSLIDAGTNYTPPCNDWKISLVSTDKWGVDKFLSPYKLIKESSIYLFEPTVNGYITISSGTTQRFFSVKKASATLNVSVDLIVSMPEYEVFTIVNNTPATIASVSSTPITVNVSGSGAVFYHGGTSILIESVGISSVNYTRSIKVMRIGTVFHILN